MFRDFDYIAAIAYEAERSAEPDKAGPHYSGLAETERMQQVERVMSCARAIAESRAWEGGNPDYPEDLPTAFEAVVRAIYGHNGGHGGLALERLGHLGQVMVDIELVDPNSPPDPDIVNCAVGFLNELVERRRQPSPAPAQTWTANSMRLRALCAANNWSGEPGPDGLVAASFEQVQATAFEFFLFIAGTYDADTEGGERCGTVEDRLNALNLAIQKGFGLPASTIVLAARNYVTFLDPPTVASVEPEPTIQ